MKLWVKLFFKNRNMGTKLYDSEDLTTNGSKNTFKSKHKRV